MKHDTMDALTKFSAVILGMLLVFVPPYAIAYQYCDGLQWYDPPTSFNILLFWYIAIKHCVRKGGEPEEDE